MELCLFDAPVPQEKPAAVYKTGVRAHSLQKELKTLTEKFTQLEKQKNVAPKRTTAAKKKTTTAKKKVS